MTQTVDGNPVDYSGLPMRHRETVRLYMEGGYPPGSGWTAILSRDLQAVVMVDAETFTDLPDIWRWLYNHAPSHAFGSAERVQSWMVARRAERMARDARAVRG